MVRISVCGPFFSTKYPLKTQVLAMLIVSTCVGH